MQIHMITPDYKALAEAMGNDITPKAVSHRIAKIRNLRASAIGDAEPTKTKKEKAPVAPKGKKGGKKRDAEEFEENEEHEMLGKEGSPKSAKKVMTED
ncbi:hypothetical protein MMC31_002474 [Peltigera leucophlebia]|nr:hypothetical protein [Peltigera leucophlebia]